MKGRSLLCAAVVGAFVLGTFALARADEDAAKEEVKPDATLSLSGKTVGAVAGYNWGTGKLHFQGKTYDVVVDGLTVGTVGISSVEATGDVYYLKKLEDFDGIYTTAAAGGTMGGGGGALAMRNEHGVHVTMTATTRGAGLTMGVSGVRLTVKK